MDRLDAYEIEKCTSRGQLSEVFQAKHVETGTAVAIKKIKILGVHPTLRKECETEVSMLQMLDHPHLIKYHTHFTHDGDLYLVMEMASGGTLAQRVECSRASNTRTDESLLWRWVYDVASALAYLHRRKILHRDVKPSHIFLGENGKAKLGDFGLSKAMSTVTQCAFSCVGTPFYMCPEIVRGEGYSFASDVWSFGCSLYELAAGYPPFYRTDMDFKSLGEAICQAKYPPLPPEAWSQEFIDFVTSILDVDPSQRPTAQQILDHAGCRVVSRIQDFRIIGTLGRGKFSEVHRSLWKAKGECEVALKRIQIFEMDAEARQVCNAEVNMLQRLEHTTIIKYLDSFFESSELVIVLELATHGDVANLCRQLKHDERTLAESQVWAVFFQACDALNHMHKHRIMHRDIKPANIFIAERGVVKLGDLGLGRYFSSNTFRAHSVVGTPFYMSPEVIAGNGGYSFKSDIWSLGCVLYEITTLLCPFAGSGLNYYALGMRISRADYAPLPEGTSSRISGLCEDMLQVQQDARPDAMAAWQTSGQHLDVVVAQAWARKREEDAELVMEGAEHQGELQRRLARAAAVVRGLLEKGPSPPRHPRKGGPSGRPAAGVAASVAAAVVSAAAAGVAPPSSRLAQSQANPPPLARPRGGYLSCDARRSSAGQRGGGRVPLAPVREAKREASPRPRTEEAGPSSANSARDARSGFTSGNSSPTSAATTVYEPRSAGLVPSPPSVPLTAREPRASHVPSPPTAPLTAREPREPRGAAPAGAPRRAASPRLAPLRAASPQSIPSSARAPSPTDSAPLASPPVLASVRSCSPPSSRARKRPAERAPLAPRDGANSVVISGAMQVAPPACPKPLAPRRANSPRTGRLASLAEQALLAPRDNGARSRGTTPPPPARCRALLQ